MLIGNFPSKLAANGRTALPKKFREQLGEHLVLLQGYERCLMLVPASTVAKLTDPNKPFSLTAGRQIDRFLLGNAFDVELHSQGRFVIPQPLKKYAELESEEVVFVGVGNRVELGHPNRWSDYQDYLAQNSSQIAEQLVQFDQSK